MLIVREIRIRNRRILGRMVKISRNRLWRECVYIALKKVMLIPHLPATNKNKINTYSANNINNHMNN